MNEPQPRPPRRAFFCVVEFKWNTYGLAELRECKVCPAPWVHVGPKGQSRTSIHVGDAALVDGAKPRLGVV